MVLEYKQRRAIFGITVGICDVLVCVFQSPSRYGLRGDKYYIFTLGKETKLLVKVARARGRVISARTHRGTGRFGPSPSPSPSPSPCRRAMLSRLCSLPGRGVLLVFDLLACVPELRSILHVVTSSGAVFYLLFTCPPAFWNHKYREIFCAKNYP